jgi:hypothetical protein
MNDRLGIMTLAAAIILAAIIIACAFRYGPTSNIDIVIDHWTGQLIRQLIR